MTQQEKTILKNIIENMEQRQQESRQDAENATSDKQYYYFYGAYVNTRSCLEEIKKQFKIK